jgi:hypothetical protein
MDNALPHMLTGKDLESAIKSIANQIKDGGMFVASIRDYDALLAEKPPYSAPYIHKTDAGQRVSFQTWDWNNDRYKLTQYIIDDTQTLLVSKFDCEYRAVRREEITNLLLANGCYQAVWLFPEETGFYQPIVVARK